MSVPVSRVLARRQWQQLAARRYASSTSTAASTAAKETASKAKEGLSRVTSSAGSVLNKAGSALGSIGGRTGRLIGFVSSLIPPTIYYSKVALELAKIVAREQKIAVPSSEAFVQAYKSAWNSIRSGGISKSLSSVRSMGTAQMVGAGILGAELIGFFSVGEIIGRLKLVGYRGGKDHDEH
ncbi:uncharacterized protein PV09_06430 [Verruconis gallopava]|uniref:Uncharacterized protein n=1 Tax=Verruconis gallopava TaxID=253628 RepID=A0A0D2A6S0_9PEZI|nr:uncharacterized protein PV09_06430 [Verruconis gallopava]KIW02280.1 hypothetical protein PV09_06430 [Verruconis gallopava]